MTEVLPGVHDMTGAIALPDDNWFFTQTEMPQGKVLAASLFWLRSALLRSSWQSEIRSSAGIYCLKLLNVGQPTDKAGFIIFANNT